MISAQLLATLVHSLSTIKRRPPLLHRSIQRSHIETQHLEVERPRPTSRSRTKNLEGLEAACKRGVAVSLGYLPFGSLWESIGPDAPEERESDLYKFKGLVPIEIKNIGILTPRNFKVLFREMGPSDKYHLNVPRSLSSNKVKKLVDILQQCICDVINYGTRYAFVMDFVNSVTLRLPVRYDSATEISLTGELEWAFIKAEERPRLALAYLMYSARREVDKLMEIHEKRHREPRQNKRGRSDEKDEEANDRKRTIWLDPRS